MARIVPAGLPLVRPQPAVGLPRRSRSVGAPWRRLRLSAFVRWGAAWLDCELASGVSPLASEALAIRARRITGRRSRENAARGLIRALFDAEDAAPGFTAAERTSGP